MFCSILVIHVRDMFSSRLISDIYTLVFGRGPNRVMETACFDANVQ